MAKYTAELGTLVDEEQINIFDFTYPFYDEAKRPEFERKFIDYFYFYEIGSETVSRFKHNLKSTFELKFPLYNRMFEVKQMEYNILKNYELTETTKRDRTVDQTQDSVTLQTTTRDTTTINDDDRTHTETGEQTKKQNDIGSGATPANLDLYATAVIKDTQTGNTTDTTDNTLIEDEDVIVSGTVDNDGKTIESETFTKTTAGDVGVATQMKALLEEIDYRRVVERIELEFFKECEDLFMQIY